MLLLTIYLIGAAGTLCALFAVRAYQAAMTAHALDGERLLTDLLEGRYQCWYCRPKGELCVDCREKFYRAVGLRKSPLDHDAPFFVTARTWCAVLWPLVAPIWVVCVAGRALGQHAARRAQRVQRREADLAEVDRLLGLK
jgi:hypothetical protein